MALCKPVRLLRAIFLTGLALSVLPCAAQGSDSLQTLTILARNMAVDLTFGPLPRSDFGQVSATIFPSFYRPVSETQYLLPLVGLQLWVSPNLALTGGLGSGRADGQMVQYVRTGLRYLPASLSFGPFTPEFTFTQCAVGGLSQTIAPAPADISGNGTDVPVSPGRYDSRWNEIGWGYTGYLGDFSLSAKLVALFQGTFIGAGRKLTRNSAFLAISAGHNIFRWFRVSAHLMLSHDLNDHPSWRAFAGGAQLSLAI